MFQDIIRDICLRTVGHGSFYLILFLDEAYSFSKRREKEPQQKNRCNRNVARATFRI